VLGCAWLLLAATGARADSIGFEGLAVGDLAADTFDTAVFFAPAADEALGFRAVVIDGSFGAPPPRGDRALAICTAANDCSGALEVSFAAPVSNLSFLAYGDDASDALTVEVFVLGELAASVPKGGFDGLIDTDSKIDLGEFTNVSSIRVSTNDPGGLAFDAFSFDVGDDVENSVRQAEQRADVSNRGQIVRTHLRGAVRSVFGGDPRLSRAASRRQSASVCPADPVAAGPGEHALPLESGLSAGEADRGFAGAWTSLAYARAENQDSRAEAESNLASLAVGVDYRVSERWLVGAAGFLGFVDTETRFDDGSSRTISGTFNPYVTFVLNQHFSFDANVGGTYGFIDNDASGVGAGQRDVFSYVVAGNANATQWFGPFSVEGRLGLVFSDAYFEPYTDTLDNEIERFHAQYTQVQIGAELDYVWEGVLPDTILMPYAGVAYHRDLDRTRSPVPGFPNGRDEVEVNAGLLAYGTGPWAGFVDFTTLQGRDEFVSYAVTANLRYRF